MSKRIYLSDENDSVYIDAYLHSDNVARPAMLVIPGGGYGMVCEDREGEPIAKAFYERGYNSFVLNYRVAPARYPAPLLDGARAIAYVRSHADELRLLNGRVATVGFSAGGHLVGLLATHYERAAELLCVNADLVKPTASIYAYPVVSCRCPSHGGSFENLSGKPLSEFTDEDKELYSIECGVKADTPPAFIWHTATDEAVPVYGSLLLAEAYVRACVPISLHIYPYGTHGVALGNEITKCGNPAWIQPLAQGWVDYASEFLKTV